MKRHIAPIIAVVLLLLPVLYVGSYLALVTPGGSVRVTGTRYGDFDWPQNYRVAPSTCRQIFWPLEQIDRKVRPEAWEQELRPWEYGEINR